MAVWIVLAVLAVAAVLALIRPFAAPAVGSSIDPKLLDPTLQIYKDQLDEIDSDRARGLIGVDDAEAARIEVSRRLLVAADKLGSDVEGESGIRGAAAVFHGRIRIAIAAVVPVMALVFYLGLGSPLIPDQPFALRAAAVNDDTGLSELVARVEARLRERPEEGQGWDIIAPVYMRQERYADAANAFERAIKLLGESPARLAGLGEARVLARDGLVTEDARKAFERLLSIAPDAIEARFWLALAKEQDGNLVAAVADYRAILAAAPSGASWRPMVQERVALIESRTKATPSTPSGQRGPTLEAAAAAQALPPAAQSAMIEQMVAGLAERLGANGTDGEGWQRLVRSYVVLGRRDDALKALANGRKALAGDQTMLGALDQLATSLGLGS